MGECIGWTNAHLDSSHEDVAEIPYLDVAHCDSGTHNDTYVFADGLGPAQESDPGGPEATNDPIGHLDAPHGDAEHCNSGIPKDEWVPIYLLDREPWIDPSTGQPGCPPSDPRSGKTSECSSYDPGDGATHTRFLQYGHNQSSSDPSWCNSSHANSAYLDEVEGYRYKAYHHLNEGCENPHADQGGVEHGDTPHSDAIEYYVDDASAGYHEDVAFSNDSEYIDTPFENQAHLDISDHSDQSHFNDPGYSDTPFGNFSDHHDIAHADSVFENSSAHSDWTNHNDTPFSNTDFSNYNDHTNSASHGDTPFSNFNDHGDTPHTDASHGDISHSDFANHGNTAHNDGNPHGNQAHVDYAYQQHNDGYYDSYQHNWHTDNAHGNTPHSDMSGHYNDPHTDSPSSHVDLAHENSSHSDVAHYNHTGAHGDTAHIDSSHGDFSNHSDVTHSDVSHIDGPYHIDTNHADSPFGNQANSDYTTHNNTTFSDFSNYSDRAFADFSNYSDRAFADSIHQNWQDTNQVIEHSDFCNHSNTPGPVHENNYQDIYADSPWDHTPHGDSNHDDVPHGDAPYQDEHNGGHNDEIVHGNVSHSDSFTDMPFCDCGHADADPIPFINQDHCNSGIWTDECTMLQGYSGGCPPSHPKCSPSWCHMVDGQVDFNQFAYIDSSLDPTWCNDAAKVIQAAVPHKNSYDPSLVSPDFDDHFNVPAVEHGDAGYEDGYTDYSDDNLHIDSHLDNNHYDSNSVPFTDKAIHCDCAGSPHSDTPHSDDWHHSDIVHNDVIYNDGGPAHTDTPHSDTPHADHECDCPTPDFSNHANQPYTPHGNTLHANQDAVPFLNQDHCDHGAYIDECTTITGSASTGNPDPSGCQQSSPKCDPSWCHAIVTGSHEGPGPEYKPIWDYQILFTQHGYSDSTGDPSWCNTPAKVIQAEVPHGNTAHANSEGASFQDSSWHCDCGIPHEDAPHSDSPHSDNPIPHRDIPHGDAPHADNHNDLPHKDTPHDNTFYD